ncbi:MAG: hypothetical protein MJ067_06100 [Oscillospiraceae bacterium]|nr:hypothetical protein [Oscillospiraceae bacterium]
MKKIIVLLIITAMLLCSLCACGGKENNTPPAANGTSEASSPASSTDTQAKAAEPLVLSEIGDDADKAAFLDSLNSEAITPLYRSITLTGTKLPMEQVYSVKDLIELAGYGLELSGLEGLCVRAETELKGEMSVLAGLDLVKLLKLCGADMSEEQRIMFRSEGEEVKCAFGEDTAAMLVLTVNGKLTESGAGLLVDSKGKIYAENVDFLMFGSCCDDPHYDMHNRAPHDVSADITFTFNIYKGDAFDRAVTYTTAELEALASARPDAVYGSYYGVIGDKDSFVTMGGGGFLDYFEGLRFDYLLKEELGITSLKGSAELFSRDDESYAIIEDLAYFEQTADNYYMCDSEGNVIEGLAIPLLAYAKNGSPLLPLHEHDSEAYVSKTPLKEALNEMGIEKPDIGTVKNHSGPFVAALGDCAGFYGGYQTETGADCVRMDIHLA